MWVWFSPHLNHTQSLIKEMCSCTKGVGEGGTICLRESAGEEYGEQPRILWDAASLSVVQMQNCSTVSVEVRKSQHKYIVGPRGHGLQEILQVSGCWVEVPSLDSDVNTITLRGPGEKLGQALTLVGY